MKKTTILKALISIILLGLVFSLVDLNKILTLLLNSHAEFLIIFIGLLLTQLLISTFNIAILLDNVKKLNFLKLFKYYCFGWTAGLISIGRIGEFSTSFYLKKEGIPYSKSVAILFLDKFITLFAFSIYLIIGTFIFFGFENIILIVFSAIILFGVIMGILILNKLKPNELPLIKRISFLKKIIEPHEKNFFIFKETFFYYFLNNKKALAKNLFFTFVKILIIAASGTVLFAAIGQNIDLFYMGYINAVASIVTLIPITISGFGVVEVTSIYTASLVGINAESFLAAYALSIFLNYSLGIVITLFGINAKKNILGKGDNER